MFRGLRRKSCNGETSASAGDNTKDRLAAFINENGHQHGIQANRDLRTRLRESFQGHDDDDDEDEESLVDKIARKLHAIPPALQSVSDAKSCQAKTRAVQELAFQQDALDAVVNAFLSNRQNKLEQQQVS